MGRRARWAVVAGVVAVLVAVPSVVAAWPVASSSVSARTLLQRIRASADVPYSAYAQSSGGLALPVDTGAFSVNDLLGGTSRLRVWWAGPDRWRVDQVDATGENDLHGDASGVWSWDYESTSAQRLARRDPVRLPRTDDLVPGNLARRLLSETATQDVTRLPTARIAGRTAAGLRVAVADRRSTVRRIDVWALPDTGLPLRVAVYGATRRAVMDSTTFDLRLGTPPASLTAFTPPRDANLRVGGPGDIVSAIDQFGRSEPPARLAGLARRPGLDLGAVGVYGRGVTVLVAIPLSGRLAGEVAPRLEQVAGASDDANGVGLAIGPISVQLSPPTGPFGARWLLVGTLTPTTLRTAADALPPPRGFGFGR